MPKMPDWAANGDKIVFDKTLPLAFIRRGGRGANWQPYALSSLDPMSRMYKIKDGGGRRTLDDARQSATAIIGGAVEKMARRCHPQGNKMHLVVDKGYVNGRYIGNVHACGIDYPAFDSTSEYSQVTCTICIASIAEDIEAKAKKIGKVEFEKAVDHVRAVRTIEALEQVVPEDKG